MSNCDSESVINVSIECESFRLDSASLPLQLRCLRALLCPLLAVPLRWRQKPLNIPPQCAPAWQPTLRPRHSCSAGITGPRLPVARRCFCLLCALRAHTTAASPQHHSIDVLRRHTTRDKILRRAQARTGPATRPPGPVGAAPRPHSGYSS